MRVVGFSGLKLFVETEMTLKRGCIFGVDGLTIWRKSEVKTGIP